MAFENFGALLDSLHKGAATSANLTDSDLPEVILINAKREFVVPKDYNTVIAYEGDVNSQVITFDCPLTHEGHNLSDCEHKQIRWVNQASGVEGNNELDVSIVNDRQHLSWRVPPEAFTKSGRLQFSISIYDLDENGYVAFQWNTSSYSGFSVSRSMDNVGIFSPARNEVLSISDETRRIVAPSGYNGVVANYGDVGTAKVFFRVNRYVRGIDVLDPATIRTIRWKLGTQIQSTIENIFVRPYSAETDEKIKNREGLVDIIWDVPSEITCNAQYRAGNFDIEVSFMSSDGKRIWRTTAFSGLSIGRSLFMMSPSQLPESEGYYVVDGNKINGTGINTEIAGIYTLRSFESGEEPVLKKNELAVEYDENGQYVGLKVGTDIVGENATTARYADKLMQGETIILDGGSASGN